MYVRRNGASKKRNSIVLWKKMEVRGPKAMYACVEKFRVIIDAP
jgi:hypothetical protein